MIYQVMNPKVELIMQKMDKIISSWDLILQTK
jgi:hypothetical protein